jgi:hypothetical protein
MNGASVFFDPTGRRRRRFVRMAGAALIAVLAVAGVFLVSLFDASAQLDAGMGAFGPLRLVSDGAAPAEASRGDLVPGTADRQARPRSAAGRLDGDRRRLDLSRDRQAVIGGARSGRALTIGFYVNWEDNGYAALAATLPRLDWLIPAWLRLQGRGMGLVSDVDQKVVDLVGREGRAVPILPLIQNTVDGKWDGEGLAALLADRAMRGERIGQLVSFLEDHGFQGITVDFEDVPRLAHKDLQAFLGEMRAAFAPHGWKIVLAVPFDNNDWDYQAYARLTDYLILMAYDQHWDTGQAGSIAGRSWFGTILRERMKVLDPAHTIVALGNYAYDWPEGQPAEDITFQKAIVRAAGRERDHPF